MSIPQVGGGTLEHESQLAEFLANGSKIKSDWKIGTEHEKFVYDKRSYLPLPYSGKRSIEAILRELQKNYDWTPIFENQHLIGLEKDGANVSLEPGGQLDPNRWAGVLGLPAGGPGERQSRWHVDWIRGKVA